MDNKNLRRIVNGKRYNVKTAKLLAKNIHSDLQQYLGNSYDTFLYQTPNGNFFKVTSTSQSNLSPETLVPVIVTPGVDVIPLINIRPDKKPDALIPLSRDQAINLYHDLHDPEAIPFDEAFNQPLEEVNAGRPTYYGKTMTLVSCWLPEKMIAWLKSQPEGNMGVTLRRLISEKMEEK